MMKKKLTLILFLLAIFMTGKNAIYVKATTNGIKGNGTGGISIDINSPPYTDFSNISHWGQYAYGSEGCAWFASARVKQLTGKGNMIYSGKSWFNTAGANLGFMKGSKLQAPAIVCWENHVAILEKLVGNTAYISEGGSSYYSDASHGYSVIRTVSTDSLNSLNSGFLGYVYLSGTSNLGNTPYGCTDSIWGGAGIVQVVGWAFDLDDVNASVSLHVYIGGEAGTPEADCHIITANNERKDVGDAYTGVGNYHGFNNTIQTEKRGNQPVYIYAINIGEGDNILIGQGNVNIGEANTPPQGILESVSGGQGGINMQGWVFDRDDVNASVSLHVYIGGEAGTPGADCHIITANKERSDIGDTYTGVGNYHGFNNSIQTEKRGNQPVYIYAINIGAGDNILLWQGFVNIENVINSGNIRPNETPEPAITTEITEQKDLSFKLETIITPNSKPISQTITVPTVQWFSLKNKKSRKIRCSWQKISGANYYSVQIALNRSFTKGSRIFKVRGTKYTKYALKKKKTYYVRVRAWKYVNKQGNVAGNWSTVKKVKIRK